MLSGHCVRSTSLETVLHIRKALSSHLVLLYPDFQKNTSTTWKGIDVLLKIMDIQGVSDNFIEELSELLLTDRWSGE